MTRIYMVALHSTDPLSWLLAGRFPEDRKAAEARNRMALWDARRDGWSVVDTNTPGLASLRSHHLNRPISRQVHPAGQGLHPTASTRRKR